MVRWGLVLLMAMGCRQVFGLEAPARIDAALDVDAMSDEGDALDGPLGSREANSLWSWPAVPQHQSLEALQG